MRNGFATSACAAAAAAAAYHVLLSGKPIQQITIDLPSVKAVTFSLSGCQIHADGVCCGVIKDAGDDPDVTHGIEIQAYVRPIETPGIILSGGKGVGRVTLPGLPVEVGEAAINPGPRKLILQVFKTELQRYPMDPNLGFEITIQVPDGEKVAAGTMNPKLGIVGGISILGTDGLVRPYSAPAFRASLFYELRVPYQNGYNTIGLTTGKRSTAYLRNILQDTRGLGVIDVGDELGYPIEQAVKMGFKKIVIGGMIGKLSKLAQGRFQTHVQEGEIDFESLSAVAQEHGASKDVCERILTARTAHQVQNWLKEESIFIEPELTRRAAKAVFIYAGKQVDIGVYLFSLNGDLLAHTILEGAHVS
jgi:cobalt-precorrin-5B (C1)-methyltransferase